MDFSRPQIVLLKGSSSNLPSPGYLDNLVKMGCLPVLSVDAGDTVQLSDEILRRVSLLLVKIKSTENFDLLVSALEKLASPVPTSVMLTGMDGKVLKRIGKTIGHWHALPHIQDICIKLPEELNPGEAEAVQGLLSFKIPMCITGPTFRKHIYAYRLFIKGGMSDAGPVVNKHQEKLLESSLSSTGRVLRRRLPVRRSHFSRKFLSQKLIETCRKLITSAAGDAIPFIKNYLIDFPVMAVDPGEKYAGFAVQKEIDGVPSPISSLKVKNQTHLRDKIRDMAFELKTRTVIVGIPYNDGFSNVSQTQIYLNLFRRVKKILEKENVSVYAFDESFSSRESEKYMKVLSIKKRKNFEHAISASIILREFLREYDIF